jgi:hypothetical protein
VCERRAAQVPHFFTLFFDKAFTLRKSQRNKLLTPLHKVNQGRGALGAAMSKRLLSNSWSSERSAGSRSLSSFKKTVSTKMKARGKGGEMATKKARKRNTKKNN